jgi:hypothetical protein
MWLIRNAAQAEACALREGTEGLAGSQSMTDAARWLLACAISDQEDDR